MQTYNQNASEVNPAVVVAALGAVDQSPNPNSLTVVSSSVAPAEWEVVDREWPHAVHDNGQLKLALMFIVKGRNPRKSFHAVEMAELTATVKLHGILQAILVRPVGDTYAIVAGERRYRAAMEAFGSNYLMPVTIREMNDEEADTYAAIENVQREDMSATEEAAAAANEVGRRKGDRDEAARVLGWSRSTLDKRLALMNCAPPVQDALNERTILLGHAELLAALAPKTQEKLLPIIIKEKKSISELKATIESIAAKLDTAIFDKSECQACPHNSTVQVSMFEQSITDGSCTNAACFKKKTEGALELKVNALKDDYPVVRIIRVGDNSTRVKLTSDGANGVGAAQAEACRSCASFGAAVSALPQAMGKEYPDQCFDTECNKGKVEARTQAELAQAKAEALKYEEAKGGGIETPAIETPAAKKEEKAEPVVVTQVQPTERMKEYRVKVWRRAMKREIVQNPETAAQYLVALCLNGCSRNIDSSALSKAFVKLGGTQVDVATGIADCAAAVEQFGIDNTRHIMPVLAASAMDGIEENKLRQLATHHNLDLSKHWKLDTAFLELMTKSEIKFVAKEVGLDVAFGDGFEKLFTEKKPDLIKSLASVEGFTYNATIPAVLAY